MTSVRSMCFGAAGPTFAAAQRRTICAMAIIAWVLVLSAGCQQRGPVLEPPSVLMSPYDRPQLWAVVPPINESGVSHVDELLVADMIVQEAEQILGITVLPVNRVIRAMRELELDAITTVSDAQLLLNALDADGLIASTVTAYDPYRPPVLGMAMQLFRRDDLRRAGVTDPVQLMRSPTGTIAPGDLGAGAPVSPVAQASGVFDASNHRVLLWLDQYATGRALPETAYGRRIYLVRMDMYTKFVSHRLLGDVLEVEYCRLLREAHHASVR